MNTRYAASVPRRRRYSLKRDEHRRVVMFGVVGLIGVGVNNGLLWLLVEHVALPIYVASVIAIEASIVVNFVLNDNTTWRDRKQGPVWVRLTRYNTSTAASSLFVNIAVLLFLREWLHVPYLAANMAGIGCAAAANYVGNSVWTYGGLRMRFPKAVWGILLTSLGVRLLLAMGLGPGFDEAYYYTYAVHPSLSYFDHPPLVGFLAGFFPYMTGVANAFTIRLAAVLLFTATGLLVYSLARRLASPSEAVAAYAVFSFTPLFMLGAGTMILPDAGMVFFWSATLVLLERILRGEDTRGRLWVGAGVLTGATMLAKYHGALLAVSLALFLVLYRRQLLRTAGPYVYAVAACVTFLPVIVWNAQHGWVSFLFQGGRASGIRFSALHLGRAVGGQALYLTPVLLPVYVWAIWRSIRDGALGKSTTGRFVLLFGALPVLLITGLGAVRPILPHWPLPGYVALTITAGALLSRALARYRWVRSAVATGGAVVGLLVLVAYMHTQFGVLQFERWAARGWIERKQVRKDATLDVHGWGEIASFMRRGGMSPDSVFLFSHKWFLSGQICLATQGEYDVTCFSRDPRGFGIWSAEQQLVGRDGVCVTTSRYRRDIRLEYGNYFEWIGPPDSVVVHRGGVPGKVIYFRYCRRLLKRYPRPG